MQQVARTTLQLVLLCKVNLVAKHMLSWVLLCTRLPVLRYRLSQAQPSKSIMVPKNTPRKGR